MDKATYDRGLKIRKSVLGDEFVDKAIATADDFNRPMQDLTTEYCWGYVWGRDAVVTPARNVHATIVERSTGLGESDRVYRDSRLQLDWRK